MQERAELVAARTIAVEIIGNVIGVDDLPPQLAEGVRLRTHLLGDRDQHVANPRFPNGCSYNERHFPGRGVSTTGGPQA